MKKFSALLVLLLAGICVSAQTISFGKKGLLINDMHISEKWQLSEFISALGKPERSTSSGYDKIHIYDKGIVLFSINNNNPGESVTELRVYFNLPLAEDRINVQKTFSGKATFNKIKLSKSFTTDKMLKSLKGKDWVGGVGLGYVPNYYNYNYTTGLMKVFFQFNESDTELIYFSFWRKQELKK